MGVIAVFTYVAVAWIALGVFTIGLLNLAKWSVRATARKAGAEPDIRPTTRPTSHATTTSNALPAPAPTAAAR